MDELDGDTKEISLHTHLVSPAFIDNEIPASAQPALLLFLLDNETSFWRVAVLNSLVFSGPEVGQEFVDKLFRPTVHTRGAGPALFLRKMFLILA